MFYDTIISTEELAIHLNDMNWLVVDCRFSLSNPDEKENAYLEMHIPGAAYAHLNRDLSGKIIPNKTGRHPFPTPQETAAFFGRIGIDNDVQVVAYDDLGGGLAAARLWQMLKWLGHKKAAVLDGGWQKWLQEDRAYASGVEHLQPRIFEPAIQPQYLADADEIDRVRLDPDFRLIDVRAQDRYRGEIEPFDLAAGHIPGAVNIPYQQNLVENGEFKSPEDLSDLYTHIIGTVPPSHVVFYCGSGVTCALSALAFQHSGLGTARIYPGSWSEWITDDARQRATGSQ